MALRRLAVTFGCGDFGRLAHCSIGPELIPRVVASLLESQTQQVGVGGAHTAVLTEGGEVWTAGLNDAGQLGHSRDEGSVETLQRVDLPDAVTTLSAGHFHTLVVTSAGELFAWGRNASGQLGLGSRKAADERTPLRVEPLAGVRIVSVAAGAEHSLAVSDSGELFAWGSPRGGRLGVRSEWSLLSRGRQPEPRLVRGLAGVPVDAVAAGHQHSGALARDGQVYLWGSNRFSQLGMVKDDDFPSPTPVPQLRSVANLALGGLHSCAITGSGQILSWGGNQNSVLGLGSSAGPNVTLPTAIPGVFARQVAAGWKHCAAVTAAGQLLTWGWGGSAGAQSVYDSAESTGGQLGHGSENDCWSPSPVAQVMGPDGSLVQQLVQQEEGAEVHFTWRIVQVSCGFNHTAAVIETNHPALLGET